MQKSKCEIYTVVEVWRGIASGVRSFVAWDDAQRYMNRVRKRQNLMEDDVRPFKSSLNLPSR